MLIYWLWLATRPDISDREKFLLLQHFQDAEDIYFAKDFGDFPENIRNSLQDKNLFEAEKILAAEGISVRLVNIHTIKPIDRDIILESAAKTGVIVTAEEHSIIGGLGSAVSDVVTESAKPVPVLKVGVLDTYGMSGKANDLMHTFEIDAATIVKRVKEAIALKN